MSKILLVEDEVDLAFQLQDWLSDEGYLVELAFTGPTSLDMLAVYKYDIVILDWMLPGKSGLEVLKEFRSRGGKTPVLMLTAKASFEDKARGLDIGSDDYLAKPFSTIELAARIRALIRRASSTASRPVLEAGDLTVDPVARLAHYSGQQIHLEPKEFNLLEFLMRNQGTAFTSETLHERVWESMTETSVDTVRTYIRTLRKKMESAGCPSLIRTVHGSGYRMDQR